MKKVVFPTDFSESAFSALKFAAELFKYDKTEFFIVHAYADEVYDHEEALDREGLDKIKKNIAKQSEDKLKKTRHDILQLFPNPRHSFQIRAGFGLLIDEVNDLVEKENADLVITSTHGKRDDQNLTFGSNTLQIIKYIQCPVLSIPLGYSFDEPKKILFPTNYLLPYQKRELKLVADLARSFGAEINMLYVSRFPLETLRQKDNQEAIREHFRGLRVNFEREKETDKTKVIKKYVETKAADLLVLVNSRHSYLENLLYHSTLDEIGLHPKIPFLVLQNLHRL